jgi:hypothetical protein
MSILRGLGTQFANRLTEGNLALDMLGRFDGWFISYVGCTEGALASGRDLLFAVQLVERDRMAWLLSNIMVCAMGHDRKTGPLGQLVASFDRHHS